MAYDPYGPDDEYGPEDSVGPGRGSVNPPMVYEEQPVRETVRTPRRGVLPRNPYVSPHDVNQATWADVAKVGETALAPVEGFIRGRSMGLIDPAAMYLEHAVTKKPLQVIAERMRADRERMEKEHPVGSIAGELFGGIKTAVKTLPGVTKNIPGASTLGKGIPAAVVEQAVQGASTAGSRELIDATAEDRNYDYSKPSISGGISAGVTGVLGAGGASVQRLAETKGGKFIAEQINKLMKEKPEGWKQKINEIVSPFRKAWAGNKEEINPATGETYVFRGKTVSGKVDQEAAAHEESIRKMKQSTFDDLERQLMTMPKGKSVDDILKDNHWTFDEYYAASKARGANQASNLSQQGNDAMGMINMNPEHAEQATADVLSGSKATRYSVHKSKDGSLVADQMSIADAKALVQRAKDRNKTPLEIRMGTEPPDVLGMAVNPVNDVSDKAIAKGLAKQFRTDPSKAFSENTPGVTGAIQEANTALLGPAWNATMASLKGAAVGTAVDYGFDTARYQLGYGSEPSLKGSVLSPAAGIGGLWALSGHAGPLLGNMAARYAITSKPNVRGTVAAGRGFVPTIPEIEKAEATDYGPEKDPYGPD